MWDYIKNLCGRDGPRGNARVSKVLDHFKSLTDELKTGMFEIKVEMTENAASQEALKSRIARLKASNAVLGGQYEGATCLRRSLTELMGQEDSDNESN